LLPTTGRRRAGRKHRHGILADETSGNPDQFTETLSKVAVASVEVLLLHTTRPT
jgi:hypothetical protein